MSIDYLIFKHANRWQSELILIVLMAAHQIGKVDLIKV